MLNVLKAQGLTDLEFMVVTMQGPTWEYHAQGFEQVTYHVMPDVNGAVYDAFGADAYNVLLIDKKGRVVTMKSSFADELIPSLNKRIRELHAE